MQKRSRNAAAPIRLKAAIVVLALTGALGCVLAAPAGAAEPEGDFTWSPPNPLTFDQVVFTASFTDADAPGGVAIGWDFNKDGVFTDDAGPTAVHTYTRSGDLDVAVLISDGVEPPVEKHKVISVANRPPVASIAVIPSNPVAGQQLTFVSTSTDADGTIGGQAWDLDNDGDFDDGGDIYATKTFPLPGEYRVRLRVVDKEDPGIPSIAEVIVVVGVAGGSGGQVIGASTLRLMAPFPIVRMAGLVRRKGIRLRLLSVNAPLGASVVFRCRGRGCPFTRRTKIVAAPKKKKAGGTAASGEVRLRRFRHPVVRSGAIVSVYVTKPGAIGKYTRFRIRSGRPPARRDRCMPPSGTVPIPCPGG